VYRSLVVENTINKLIIDALMWKMKPGIVLPNGFRFCPSNATVMIRDANRQPYKKLRAKNHELWALHMTLPN